MQKFLVDFNLMEDEQHGSRNGRGTLSQLLAQHDMLANSLMEGNDCNLIYLDFSKAFDLVDHSGLIRKMAEKRFGENLLRWNIEFLSL